MEQKTFTPGMVGRKIAGVLLGVSILSSGVIWLWHPMTLWFTGVKTDAQVVRVEKDKPGQEPIQLTTRKEVMDSEDPTRNAVFKYWVRFTTEDGKEVESLLNYGQVVRPLRSITDIVGICYDRNNPTDLVETDYLIKFTFRDKPYQWIKMLSVRSSAFGMFFVVIGLLIFITQLIILLHARKPIVIDGIHSMAQDAGKK